MGESTSKGQAGVVCIAEFIDSQPHSCTFSTLSGLYQGDTWEEDSQGDSITCQLGLQYHPGPPGGFLTSSAFPE